MAVATSNYVPSNGFLVKLSERFQKAREVRRTVEELNRLDDRELADLGISRADIREIARKSAK